MVTSRFTVVWTRSTIKGSDFTVECYEKSCQLVNKMGMVVKKSLSPANRCQNNHYQTSDRREARTLPLLMHFHYQQMEASLAAAAQLLGLWHVAVSNTSIMQSKGGQRRCYGGSLRGRASSGREKRDGGEEDEVPRGAFWQGKEREKERKRRDGDWSLSGGNAPDQGLLKDKEFVFLPQCSQNPI